MRAFTTNSNSSTISASVLVADATFEAVFAERSFQEWRLEPATGRIKHYSEEDGLTGGEFRSSYRDRTERVALKVTGLRRVKR
jgi:hypothetical protein